MAKKGKKKAGVKAGVVYRYMKSKATKKGGMNAGRLLMRSAKDGIALAGARRLPDFAGNYQGSVDKIVAGGALKVFRQGGSALIEVGIAEALANAIDSFVIPAIGGMIKGAPAAATKTTNGGMYAAAYTA